MNSNPLFENVRSDLARRIVALREEQRITQTRFALMIGMDRTYLNQIEHAKRNPTLDNLVRIAVGLNVTLSDLFEGIDLYAEPR